MGLRLSWFKFVLWFNFTFRKKAIKNKIQKVLSDTEYKKTLDLVVENLDELKKFYS